MGKTMMGGVKHEGNVDLLSQEQQGFLGSALSPQTQQLSGQAFQQGLQPMDTDSYDKMFQKSFIDPAQQAMQRQIIPGIKEQFMGMDESGSSALNQALAQAATDVSTGLGSQYMNQYNTQQGQQQNLLQLLSGLSGQKTFEPMIHQSQGLLSSLMTGLGGAGAGLLSGAGAAGGFGKLFGGS